MHTRWLERTNDLHMSNSESVENVNKGESVTS